MPSHSKKQQRLFGWALACKKGTSKHCPAGIKKLGDSMSEEELKKYASTSHEGLHEKVKESLAKIFEIYAEIVEAETGEDLETYEFELNEAKAEVPEEIQMLPLKGFADAKSVPTANDPDGIKKDSTGSIDNRKVPPVEDWQTLYMKKDFPEKKLNPGHDGMEPAKKSVMGNIYTPSIHKFPMSTHPKNERRIFDFKDFLKIIKYATHDDTLQAGHGSNRDGMGRAGMA